MSSCETTALKRAVTRLMVLSTKREKRVLNSRQALASSAINARTSVASSLRLGGWAAVSGVGLGRRSAGTVVNMGKGILAFEGALQHAPCLVIIIMITNTCVCVTERNAVT